MDDYVWYTRYALPRSDELRDMLLDGWEPYAAIDTDDQVALRKLVTRDDFELLWLQDREAEAVLYVQYDDPNYDIPF